MKISWTPQARGDLEAIREYIARDSAKYARMWVGKLVKKAQLLSQFPQLGRDVPEALEDEPLKEVLVGDYRIIYGLGDGEIVIVTVMHGAREFINK